MGKRIISIILSLAAAAAILPMAVNAEPIDEKSRIQADERAELVLQLGLFQKDGEGKYNFDEPVTRGETAQVLYNVLAYSEGKTEASDTVFNDVKPWHTNAAAVQYLYSRGIILGDGTGNFYPEESIAVKDVYKMLLTAANYGAFVDMTNDAAVIKAANGGKLSAGVNAAANAETTVWQLVRIIYNYLDLIVMEYDFSDSGAVKNGDTVSRFYMELEKAEGIMYSGGGISIINEDIGDDSVNIDGIYLEDGGTDYTEYVGYNVRAYYIDSKDKDETVVACVKIAKKNSVLVLESEEIENFVNGTYRYRDANGYKEARIASGISELYNNEVKKAEDPYIPENGTVRLISNDGDSKYDVVMIEDYDDYIVRGINSHNEEIIVESVSTGKRSTLPAKEDELLIFDTDMTEMTYADVRKEGVLSVPKNMTGRSFTARARYSSGVVSGVIEECTTERGYELVTIDGEQYYARLDSDAYGRYLGVETDFRINFRGVIVYAGSVGAVDSGSWRFGYVIKARKIMSEETGEDVFNIKLLDQDGEILRFDCDEKTVLNGEKAEVSGIEARLRDTQKNLTLRQPIRYKVNDAGYIKYIDTAESYTEGAAYSSNDCMLQDISGLYLFKKNSRIFKRLVSGSKGEGILNDSAVVFNVPPRESTKDYSDDRFEVIATNGISDNKYCIVDTYKTNAKSLAADCCVVYLNGDNNFSTTQTAMMIKSIREVYDEEMGKTREITVMYSNKEETYTAEDEDVFTDNNGERLRKGDVVRILTNKYGYVTSVELLYSETAVGGKLSASSEIYAVPSGINADFRMSFGNPYRIDDGNLQLVFDTATSGDEFYRMGTAAVTIFDSEDDTVYKGTIDDIEETKYGSKNKVLVQQHQTGVRQIFVIK